MLKYILTFIYILLIAAGSHGQHYTLSNESIDDPGFEYVKVIGQNDEGFFLLQSNLSLNTRRDRIGFKNRKYKISYYDFSLRQIWSKKLETESDQTNIDLITMFNGHPFVLSSQWQRNENSISFTGELMSSRGELFNRKNIGKITYEKGSEVEKPDFIVSRNNLTAALIIEENRSDIQQLHTLIFDTAFTLAGSSKHSINYPLKNIAVTEFAISDKGDIGVLAEHVEKNPEGRRNKLIQYKLFLIQREAAIKEYAVSSGNKQLTEASLSMDNINNKAVVTGFFNDNDSYTGTGIIFASLLLGSADSLQLRIVNIDESSRIKLIGERNSGANTGLYNYPIRKLILRSDGGAVVIAEAAYYSEYSYYDYFTQSFTRRTEYHFDNVVIMSIHTDGTIDWSNVLRKSQETIDDGGFLSSFTTVLQSDQIGLIYNNDISRNNEVTVFAIDNKGTSEQKTIARSSEHITIIPHSGKQVDENTLITAAIQKKRLYLMKIEL